MLSYAKDGATFNQFPFLAKMRFGKITKNNSRRNYFKKIKLFVIDGTAVALNVGMGSRVNTIMQTCFLQSAVFLKKIKPSKQSNFPSKKLMAKKVMKLFK